MRFGVLAGDDQLDDHGKNIPVSQLPAYDILLEWYTICEEEGVKHVRPVVAAAGPSNSQSSPANPQLK